MNCSLWRESFIAVLSGAAITPHLRDLMDDHLSDCDACEARDHMTCEQFQRWEPQIYTAGFMNILQLQCRNHEEGCAACADWSTRRYLKERGVDDPDAYPCLHVALHSLHTCEEFIEQMPLWDRVGVHAIFSERPLRVCDLPDGSREAILERFGVELEIAMGDATCDGFTELATPHPLLIERAAQALEALGQRELIESVQG